MYEDIPKCKKSNLISDGGSDGDSANNNAGMYNLYISYPDNYRKMPDGNMKSYLNILSL